MPNELWLLQASSRPSNPLGQHFSHREFDNVAYFFEYDSPHKIFLVRFEGRVTDEEFEDYYRVAGEHITRLRPLATVSDFSGVSNLQVSAQTIRNLAHSYIAMPASNPRVVVAPAKHIYGLARMFQIEGEPTRTNLHVVSTLAEAYELLQLRDAHFERIQIATGTETKS